jgi:hypothetical protein
VYTPRQKLAISSILAPPPSQLWDKVSFLGGLGPRRLRGELAVRPLLLWPDARPVLVPALLVPRKGFGVLEDGNGGDVLDSEARAGHRRKSGSRSRRQQLRRDRR